MLEKNVALIIDLIAIVVAIFLICRGFLRGFSGEIISFVGFSVALFCTWKFLDPAVVLFRRFFPSLTLDDTVVSIICGVIIFFGIELIFALISALLSYMVKVTQLTVMDHLFGIVIGLLKTFIIVMFCYVIMSSLPMIFTPECMSQSYTMTGASHVWPPIRDFLTENGFLDFEKLTGK